MHRIDAPHIPWHAPPVSTALHCSAGLDLPALLQFTTSAGIFSDDRRVLSWVDPASSGYPYDECTALYARLYSWLGRAQDAMAISDVLDGILTTQGWLGRDNIGYAFDTALCIDSVSVPEHAVRTVSEWLTSGKACTATTRVGWWSQSYGAHLLKCLPPLARHGRRHIAHAIADDLIEQCFDHGRFRIHAGSRATYIHSHCYAMEGLLGLGEYREVLLEAASWLAQQMRDDGSLPAWVHTENDRYPSDVVAQAVRLFAAIEPSRFQDEIALGLQRLAMLQDPATGGIRYTARSSHINTWVSAFALQACEWAKTAPRATDIKWLI